MKLNEFSFKNTLQTCIALILLAPVYIAYLPYAIIRAMFNLEEFSIFAQDIAMLIYEWREGLFGKMKKKN